MMSVGRSTKSGNAKVALCGLMLRSEGPVSAIELRDCAGYLRLPDAAMQSVGYAALTLAGVLHYLNNKTWETWASRSTIAESAGVPLRTVARHLDLLVDRKWLIRRRPGNRKTCTLRLTSSARKKLDPFVALPHWWEQNPCWSSAFVYATVLSHLSMIEHVAHNQPGDPYEIICVRTGPSLSRIQDRTGLSRQAVCNSLAKIIEGQLLIREWIDARGVAFYSTPIGWSTDGTPVVNGWHTTQSTDGTLTAR